MDRWQGNCRGIEGDFPMTVVTSNDGAGMGSARIRRDGLLVWSFIAFAAALIVAGGITGWVQAHSPVPAALAAPVYGN